MIFPHGDAVLLHIYQCGVCDRMYMRQTGPTIFRCAVAHQPGSCCHYMEMRIAEESMRAIQAIIEGAKDAQEEPAHVAD